MYMEKKLKTDKLDYHNTTKVAYWRKANQIRQWIVTNCGYDSNSNVEYFLITKEQLKKLYTDCKNIIEKYENGSEKITTELVDYCKEVMPTKSGFFFGDTAIDEWYFEDIKNTLRQVADILINTDFDKEDIYYYEWW